jgi:hypothetical protein
MATLRISSGFVLSMPRLGRIRVFQSLSEKRITKCVREALREEYGDHLDEVSCSAVFIDSYWCGTCQIDEERFTYSISTR